MQENDMREITYAEAIREALCEEMRADPRVFLLGEDIGIYGGAFGVTKGMVQEFGEERVRDTPLSEHAITEAAAGAAMTGMRPVVEIMFSDFLTIALEQLANQAAKAQRPVRRPDVGPHGAADRRRLRKWRGRAALAEPRSPGPGHVPVLKVVIPSTPYDAKGLLKSAILVPYPFIEQKLLYRLKGPVPDPAEAYDVSPGRC